MTSEDAICSTLAIDDNNPHPRSGNSLVPNLLEKLEVPELRNLLELRKQGWSDKKFDQAFSAQRALAVAPNRRAKIAWFKMMKDAFGEMNDFASFAPISGDYKFLDLGCCPGGFTSYILSSNPDAKGVGISLPVQQGGHEYSLEPRLRSRMKLNWADLTYYKLHPSMHELRGKELQPLPDTYKDFDLVILDSHYLHDLYLSPVLAQPEPWDNHRLWVSQMIIALRSIKDGGTIVIKLSHVEWTATAQDLYLLDILSSELRTYKPRKAHTKRGTFYAIAKGVGHGRKGSLKAEFIQKYEDLWHEISFGGEEGKGRWLAKDDFNFIVSYEELADEYLERLAELGKDPWIIQANSLRKMLKAT
ncbi:hypothetical protein BDY19DRAFT_954328 [Irpex rosettiformis]|uniref:Uncharacterized protein n=1 Tax=Irpex rosettiformis TaxID=378272 RepID=A0ACB8TZW2_9APHY|nr:hypothetical protein BDY19DRAFT_954328 [Irpex rosettiformis]